VGRSEKLILIVAQNGRVVSSLSDDMAQSKVCQLEQGFHIPKAEGNHDVGWL